MLPFLCTIEESSGLCKAVIYETWMNISADIESGLFYGKKTNSDEVREVFFFTFWVNFVLMLGWTIMTLGKKNIFKRFEPLTSIINSFIQRLYFIRPVRIQDPRSWNWMGTPNTMIPVQILSFTPSGKQTSLLKNSISWINFFECLLFLLLVLPVGLNTNVSNMFGCHCEMYVELSYCLLEVLSCNNEMRSVTFFVSQSQTCNLKVNNWTFEGHHNAPVALCENQFDTPGFIAVYAM